jgi:transcriptional regulator
MYIPEHFAVNDRQEILSFLRRHDFAILVSTHEGRTTATHLPLVLKEKESGLTVTGHMAKANSHWQDLAAGAEALAIFAGPHAYISPSLYDSKLSVPTWNYAAVHVYGHAQLVDPLSAVMSLVEATEPRYRSQWEELTPEFRAKMLGGIVAFEITVERLEAKYKLSQNRSKADQLRVLEAFQGTELGALMSSRLKG